MDTEDKNGLGRKDEGPERHSSDGLAPRGGRPPGGQQGYGRALLSPADRKQLARDAGRRLARAGMPVLPNLIIDAAAEATNAFLQFFLATIRNVNTRLAYARAVAGFLNWCEERGLTLERIRPLVVAAYIEKLTRERSAPTVAD